MTENVWRERGEIFCRKGERGIVIRGNLPSLAGVLDRLNRKYNPGQTEDQKTRFFVGAVEKLGRALETGSIRGEVYFGCDRIDYVARMDEPFADSDPQSPLYGSRDHLEMFYRGFKEVV